MGIYLSDTNTVCIYFIITELMSDMLAQRPEEDTSLDNIIVVDNAPIVGPDRLSKLKAVLKKIFQRFGDIVTEFYPVNENNETKGYVVVLTCMYYNALCTCNLRAH